MRITNGMMRNNSLNSLYDNMGRMNTLFDQMNTLKKIQRPSDDPIVAGRSLKLRLNVMETEQHKNNVDEAKAWMDVTETALSNMTGIIKEIRTRATQASNGTLTAEDKKKVVSDIEQLYKQLQQESNVTYAGRYVFSGFKTDQPVFLDKEHTLSQDTTLKTDTVLSGDSVLGADTELKGEITIPKGTALKNDILDKDGNVVKVNIGGVDVELKAGTTLPGEAKIPVGTELGSGTVLPKGTTIGKDNVLPKGTTLPPGMLNPEVLGHIGDQNIQYEIGVNNTMDVNTTGIPTFMKDLMTDIEDILGKINDGTLTDEELSKEFSALIGEMDGHLKTVSAMESDLGSRQNRLEYTESRLADDKTNLTALLSKTEDVNLEEVYVEFNTQYMIYQSALQATSKIVMNSLADFLR